MENEVQNQDSIPSELINLKLIYERRVLRRKEAFEECQRDLAKSLDSLIGAHRKAVHIYEDYFDDGLLKYGRDPNKMAIDERNPTEVREARRLKRVVEEAELAVRKQEGLLTAELKARPEYKSFRLAEVEFEDWLAQICSHFRCAIADLDWAAGVIKRKSIDRSLPSSLLVLPSDS